MQPGYEGIEVPRDLKTNVEWSIYQVSRDCSTRRRRYEAWRIGYAGREREPSTNGNKLPSAFAGRSTIGGMPPG